MDAWSQHCRHDLAKVLVLLHLQNTHLRSRSNNFHKRNKRRYTGIVFRARTGRNHMQSKSQTARCLADQLERALMDSAVLMETVLARSCSQTIQQERVVSSMHLHFDPGIAAAK